MHFTSVNSFAEVMSNEGMKDWFVKVLKTNHAPDINGRIKVCDVENLYVPYVPSEIKVGGFVFDGENYYFNLSGEGDLDGTFEILTKEEYENRRKNLDFSIASEKLLNEGKDTTYGTIRRNIVFEVKNIDNLDCIVVEDYSDRLGYASRIYIYGEGNDEFFCVSIWNLEKAHQRDWYVEFGVQSMNLLE